MFSMQEVDLSGCNCCAGISVETPVQIRNLPGLSAIAYRVGTYTQFLHSMQTRLADSNLPGLNALKTRQPDDFTIALLDSWSMVCDVLTFYQERIANESYKRTATESASLRELARLVGYRLQPGVAADTLLVYTLDETPGSPGQAIINIGTQAQSLPGPGEKPQVFETSEMIVARAKWNAMKPVSTMPQPIYPSTLDIWLDGTATNLKSGDTIVIVDTGNPSQEPVFHHVQKVEVDTTARQTHVLFEGYHASTSLVPLASSASSSTSSTSPVVEAFKGHEPLTDARIRQLISDGASQSQLETLAMFQGWSTRDLFAAIAAQSSNGANGPAGPLSQQALMAKTATNEQAFTSPQVFALRQRASLFGANAPDWKLMPQVVKDSYTGQTNTKATEWPYTIPSDKQQLDLDRVYSQIAPDSWIVVARPDSSHPGQQVVKTAQVAQVQEKGDSNYALSLKVTHLVLRDDVDQPQSFSDLRQVTVYVQSEPLKLVEIPVTDPVKGATITVNGVFDGLYAGRRMVVTGQTDSLSGVSTSEFVLLDHTQPQVGNRTILYLKNGGLTNSYIASSVTINANVVAATQGESVRNEILGSGDATQAFQSFTLRQSPLTYVQAPTQPDKPDGKASTLQVFVNNIQWNEVDTFYGRGAHERIFVTHIGDDGKVSVQFGDGRTGARLPTGEDNVTASYRTGSGTQGLVKPGQISLLKTRPLGVKGVSNPLTPTGAVDPDTIDDARRMADNTVLTLGRIVSGSDYEEFALSYADVDKAKATVIWNNTTKSVFVTIAGAPTAENPAGTEIIAGSGIYNKIYAGMRKASDPTIPFFLQSYTTPFFRLAARVKVDPNYASENVLRDVEQAILSDFSFTTRSFGQNVILKEVIASTQKVPGVVTVRFYSFYRIDQPPAQQPNPDVRLDENLSLPAAQPQVQDDGTITLAELLIVDPNQPFDSLEVMP